MTPASWVCPSCGTPLRLADDDLWSCGSCSRAYPVAAGIPDLRLHPDPFIGRADDRDKATRLMRRAGDGSLESMLRAYYEMTPDVPAEMAHRYTSRAIAEPGIARGWLREIESRRASPGGGGTARQPTSGPHPTSTRPEAAGTGPPRLLQVGCRTGGLLEIAAAAGYRVTGVDVAFRWLAVARRRIELAGAAVETACANAEHLPLPDESVDVLVAADLLQHVAEPAAAVAEFRRVLRPGGGLYVTTPNRFSLGPEAHTRIWWLGYLPRRWAVRVVRARRDAAYETIRLLSVRRLRRLLADGWQGVEIWPGGLPAGATGHLGGLERGLAAAYEGVRRAPVARTLLLGVGPLLHAWAETEPGI